MWRDIFIQGTLFCRSESPLAVICCILYTVSCSQPYSVSANWMTLLSDVIADKRLGDLALPGSHDAGTRGCDVNSYLIERSQEFQVLWDFLKPVKLIQG